MTPVPLDLPLRPPDAAEVASLVFSIAERKPLTEEVRARVASRLAALRLQSLRPYPGSLERDPVHHSSYYMAVDAQNGEPLLLHMASAAAPTSSIFPKPLLIGRVRQANGPETVLNAIPFGPADYESIERFAAKIDQAFLPRAQGSRPALVVRSAAGTFEHFRSIWKTRRKNVASIEMDADDTPEKFYYSGIWEAIRAGWREGFTAGISLALGGSDLDVVRETIRQAAPLTRFSVDVSRLVPGSAVDGCSAEPSSLAARFGTALQAAERVHEIIRQTRAARQITRPFDFELSLENGAPTTPGELVFCLGWLKARGHAAQLFAPCVAPDTDLPALAAAARSSQYMLSLDERAGDLASIGHATAGRVNFRLQGESPASAAAELFG